MPEKNYIAAARAMIEEQELAAKAREISARLVARLAAKDVEGVALALRDEDARKSRATAINSSKPTEVALEEKPVLEQVLSETGDSKPASE